MKVVILSDIHGSSYYASKIEEIERREQPDKIVLLGDLYYHGPRNALTQEYNPMEVARILNERKDKIIAIRGNCDAQVDEMISEFKMGDHVEMEINGYHVFFTHGHVYNKEHMPPTDFDVLIYGHFHVGFIEEKEGIIFASPGSMALPKDQTEHSYLLWNEKELILKELDGKEIMRKEMK